MYMYVGGRRGGGGVGKVQVWRGTAHTGVGHIVGGGGCLTPLP